MQGRLDGPGCCGPMGKHGGPRVAPHVFWGSVWQTHVCARTRSALRVSGTCCLPLHYLEVAKSISARGTGHGAGPLGMAGSGGDPRAAPGAVGLCVPWPGQGQGHHFLHKTLWFRSFSANGLLQEQDLHAGPDPLNGESSVHRALSSRGFHAFPFPSPLVSSFLLRQKDVESSLLSFARQLAATPRLSLARAEQLMGPWGCSRAAKLFPAPAGPRQRAAATFRPIPPNATRF